MVTLRRNQGGSEMSTISNGARTLLFIHGFLDDATVWDGVIRSLGDKVNTVRYDLPGFGARAAEVAEADALSLEALAAEAGEMLKGIDSPVIVVGQSMGTQIAELVAADHAEQVEGLVLITPVPLGGTRLPEEATAPFRALAGDLAAQRAARSALSPELSDEQLDQLSGVGAQVSEEIASRYVTLWNNGVTDAPRVSAFTGPVLAIRGGADGFVTEELMDAIVPRFPGARAEILDRGGHWLHVEYPDEVAAMILDFIDGIAGGNTADGWRRGFGDQSREAFADAFAEDVVLEATTLPDPVEGRDNVAAVLATASSIYESLEFTSESHDGSTTFLQWRATAFGGMQIKGISVLERDAHGKVIAAAIHHRPLGVVLRFSAEIRDRLGKETS
jgi:pimeloyl-ACP methyl ester carboxylesterase